MNLEMRCKGQRRTGNNERRIKMKTGGKKWMITEKTLPYMVLVKNNFIFSYEKENMDILSNLLMGEILQK
jgi:hypothetical protein